MGLDVYLYRYENFEDTQKREKEYSDRTEGLWIKSYDLTSNEEKEEIRVKEQAIADELQLDKYGTDKTKAEKIEINSILYPEHYFKIGYFRSSYNDGGINHVLRNFGIMDLNDIFDNPNGYTFKPNWEAALKNAKHALKELRKKGNYSVMDISENIFGASENAPTSEKEALDLFIAEVSRKDNSGMEAYSNKEGHFYTQGLKVLGLISGTNEMLRRKTQCTYVIYEGKNKWYIEALEIVVETIEYVLSKTDTELYYLHWSG